MSCRICDETPPIIHPNLFAICSVQAIDHLICISFSDLLLNGLQHALPIIRMHNTAEAAARELVERRLISAAHEQDEILADIIYLTKFIGAVPKDTSRDVLKEMSEGLLGGTVLGIVKVKWIRMR